MADEYAVAARFRDYIDDRVKEVIDKVRPRVAYAEVKAIDRVNRVLTIAYPGPEESEVDIPIKGTDLPAVVGQFVLVEGEKGNRVATSPQLVEDADLVVSTAHEFAGGTPHRLSEVDPVGTEPFSSHGPSAGYSITDRVTADKRTSLYMANNEFVVWKNDTFDQLKVKAFGTTAALKGLVAGVDAEIVSEPLETGGSLSGLRIRHRDNAAKQTILYATADEYRIHKDGADKVVLRSNNRMRFNAGIEVGTTGHYFVESGSTHVKLVRSTGVDAFHFDCVNKVFQSDGVITALDKYAGGTAHASAAVLNTAGSENTVWFDWTSNALDIWVDSTKIVSLYGTGGTIFGATGGASAGTAHVHGIS